MSSFIGAFTEFPYTFPITFGEVDKGVFIEDGSEAVQIAYQSLAPYEAFVHPYSFWENWPGNWFFDEWTPGIGTPESVALMPEYSSQYLYGDIVNMQYTSLALFSNAHFGPNATGDFPEPGSLEILIGPGDLEIRRPL